MQHLIAIQRSNVMIRLLAIVPYPELMEKICAILESPVYKSRLDATIQLVTVDKADQINPDGYDLIIARGYTALTLRKMPQIQIPILSQPITSYDILRAISDCKKLTFPAPKKIGLIGHYDDFHAAATLQSLLDVEIQVIINDDISKIDSSVEQAAADGCDAIVGGYSAQLAAEARGIPAVFIRTGDEAIRQVFDEAIRIVEMAQSRQIQNEMYRTVIQSSHEAILYVNKDGLIIADNPSALSLVRERQLTARKLNEVLPYMCASCSRVLETGQEITGEIHRSHDRTISVSYTPILVKGRADGVMIVFQDASRIQKMEASIRKTLSDKGLRAKYTFDNVLHQSEIMKNTIAKARSFAATSSNIMLLGESGTGKELFAQSIHNCSTRKDGPFVAINCAALPENLLESELFGYVQGAFTGANKGGKTGLFELAHGGTLFLDEISEVSMNVQTKLLRVLQEREVRKIGDDNVISINVRIICATNRNLKHLVEEGRFRQDLLYRLDVLRVFLPPLRQREQDILLLFNSLMESYYLDSGHMLPEITPEAQQLLLETPFMGNVRELRNIVERVCVLHTDSSPITAQELSQALSPEDICLESSMQTVHTSAAAPTSCLEPAQSEEYLRIQRVLQKCGGNQSKAARELGIDRSTLWRKLKKYQHA